ncbi:hypothetical protein D499_0AQ00240 [Hanseniaspora uvarum DSM 2768]|nr:hypothetical protein D499_0AQ00240 [Hanseniaspora uvarum DSM 2768]
MVDMLQTMFLLNTVTKITRALVTLQKLLLLPTFLFIILTFVPVSQPGKTCLNRELWTSFPNFVDSNGNEILLPTTNLVYNMVGLSIPLQSGKPSFYLNYIDDLGIVSIGWGLQNSGDCCSNFNASWQVIQGSSIFSVWTQSGPSGTNVLDIELLQGVAYPISVFYLNVGNLGTISVSYVDPNGVNHTDFSGFVYNKKRYLNLCLCKYHYIYFTMGSIKNLIYNHIYH